MCVCVCQSVSLSVCLSVCIYCIYIYIYIYIYMYVCMYITCMNVCKFVHMYACWYDSITFLNQWKYTNKTWEVLTYFQLQQQLCSYINCMGFLFLSKPSPNNGWIVKSISKTILLTISAVLLLLLRKSLVGFIRIFISTFSCYNVVF